MTMSDSIDKVITCLLLDSGDEITYKVKVQYLDALKQLTTNKLSGVNYALVRFISNIYSIRISLKETSFTIPQDDLERILASQINSLIFRKEFKLQDEIKNEGLTFDLSIPKDSEDVVNYFYSKILERISGIYSDQVSLSQCKMELISLRKEILTQLFIDSQMQMSEAYNVKGIDSAFTVRDHYNSIIDDVKAIPIEEDGYSTETVIDVAGYDTVNTAVESLRSRSETLYQMGIPPYDERFGIQRDDIAVIVAEINVGKTRFMLFQAYKALTAKNNVTIVSTETSREQIIVHLILAHMFTLFGHREVTIKDYLSYLDYDESHPQYREAQQIISDFQVAATDLYNRSKYGNLRVVETISFEKSLEFFKKERQVYGSDIIFIDHVRDLEHEGKTPLGIVLKDEKSSLQYLSKVVKFCKKEYSLAFMLFSHPRSNFSTSMTNEKVGSTTNLTAGATEISESATRMFYLTQTLADQASDFVRITMSKTRIGAKDTKPYVLSRMGASNIHLYQEEYQISDNDATIDPEDLLSDD